MFLIEQTSATTRNNEKTSKHAIERSLKKNNQKKIIKR